MNSPRASRSHLRKHVHSHVHSHNRKHGRVAHVVNTRTFKLSVVAVLIVLAFSLRGETITVTALVVRLADLGVDLLTDHTLFDGEN